MKTKAIKMGDLVRLAQEHATRPGSEWVDVEGLINALLHTATAHVIKGTAPDNLRAAIMSAEMKYQGERITTMEGLAALFGVTRKTIHNWVERYDLELWKIPGGGGYSVTAIIEQLSGYIEG
jgi:hypothetical protein